MLFVLCAIVGATSGPAMVPAQTTRSDVVRDIQRLADQDAKANSRDSRTAVLVFRDNAAGLTPAEIADVYNRRYAAKAQEGGVFAWFKDHGWIGAILLVIALIFRDVLKSWVTVALNTIGVRAYDRLAGLRLLRWPAIRRYRRKLLDATSVINIPFRPNRPLILSEIYVEVRFRDDPSRPPILALQALQQQRRIVLTGPPGAGKSVFLRHMAFLGTLAATNRSRSVTLPVLIELHRLSGEEGAARSVEEHVVAAFERYGFPRAGKFVQSRLRSGGLLLLLDGLDEVPSGERRAVAQKLANALQLYAECPAVVTCRTAVYQNEFNAIAERIFEIEPFRDQQIQGFLRAWTNVMPPGKSPEQLMAALRAQPKLLLEARNPLLLTIVAHLYSDNPTYVFPRSRADFYRQASQILLDQWQGHLGQNRFEGPEKAYVLRQLALEMQQVISAGHGEGKTISRKRALACVLDSVSNLGGRQPEDVIPIVDEIVHRSGLVILVDGGERYSFAHLSFQEYFAAEALLDQPTRLFDAYAGNPDWWREVLKLWCGLAGDSTALVERLSTVDQLIALECVAEARAVDQSVADGILAPITEALVTGSASDSMVRALGAVASDTRPRGDAVLRFLVDELAKAADPAIRLAVAGALAASNHPDAARAIAAVLPNDAAMLGPLLRLGDLAVDPLKEILVRHKSPHVVACLGEIGTPAAARVLLDEILAETEVCTAAAWCLAGVIANPSVAEALKDTVVPDELRRDRRSLDWIWKPVDDAGDLPWIVGRAAALIDETEDASHALMTPDVRIATALLAKEPSPLRLTPDAVRPSPGVLRVIAEVDAERDRTAVGERPGWTYRELLALAKSDAGLLKLRSETKKHDERFEQLVEAILDSFGPRTPWVVLARGIAKPLRLELFSRLSHDANLNEQSWRSVVAISSYAFARSRYYLGVLLILSLLLGAVTFEAVSMVARTDQLTFVNTLVLGVCLALIALPAVLRLESTASGSRLGIDPDTLMFFFLIAPIVLLLEGYSELKKVIEHRFGLVHFFLLVYGSLALLGGLWLAVRLVLERGAIAAAALSGAAVLGIVLARLGLRKARATNTPLAGLLTHEHRPPLEDFEVMTRADDRVQPERTDQVP